MKESLMWPAGKQRWGIPLTFLLMGCGAWIGKDDETAWWKMHDVDGDGYDESEDCEDGDPEIHPGADELCNGKDDDCDGALDESATDAHNWYLDADDDGYGDPTKSYASCFAPKGYVAEGWDCDDRDSDFHPGTARDLTQLDIPMVCIPPGTFQMGSPVDEVGRFGDETQHEVTLTRGFLIGQHEVTQGQFQGLMGYNPSRFDECGSDCPVESLSWHEAAAFANALSDTEVLERCYCCTGSGESVLCELDSEFATPYACPGYRLPTEAEWEYPAPLWA